MKNSWDFFPRAAIDCFVWLKWAGMGGKKTKTFFAEIIFLNSGDILFVFCRKLENKKKKKWDEEEEEDEEEKNQFA